MNAIDNAFVLIHIRLSHLKIFGMSLRHGITSVMVLFILANAIRLYQAAVIEFHLGNFSEAATFIVLTIYATLIWVKTWPTANKMLGKAGDYENDCRKPKED